MKAALLVENEKIEYSDIETPKAGPNDVLVRVAVTGICGSDVPRVLSNAAHYYPIVLGHEFSGYVVEVGENVKSVSKDDHVVGVPLLPCMDCEDCKNGNYSLCKKYSFVGSRINGSMAEYVSLPEQNVFKIDKDIPYESAAFFEPSTVALHGIYQSKFNQAENVAVIGSGTIGLFTMQWLKILGAKKVSMFDVDNHHLEIAKKLDADYAISSLDEKLNDTVNDITNGRGYEFVYVTTGAPQAIKTAFDLCQNKGTICLIGTPTKEITFSVREWETINRKEMFVTGSWMSYSSPWPGKEWSMTSEHFADGSLRLIDEMIYKTYPLSECMDAFNEYKTPSNIKGKIQISSI